MNQSYITFTAFANFLLYGGAGLLLTAVFAKIYILTTPYNEIIEINEGRKAPAVALGGAILGFAIPLSCVIHFSVNLVDTAIWGVISGLVQLALYKVLYRTIPLIPSSDNHAVGVVYAFISVSAGLLSASALIPA